MLPFVPVGENPVRLNSMPPDPLLENLNDPQREAVMHRDGPLLVLAGPGSGKTRVITRRAAYLVRGGVAPWHVLAITFTNKAAEEMKRRIESLGAARGMWVYTFHALGARLLREFGALARVTPGFTIYDEGDQLKCVKEAQELCGVSGVVLRPETTQQHISRAKNALLSPERLLEASSASDERTIARIYGAYETLLEQRNAVDFDDLLLRVAVVLRDHPDVAERLNERFQYVLIDEYQDTNHAQYLIARLLSKHHRNICATGDPDQSIYGWRGADLKNILEFERDYPDVKVVRLEQNYRSTPGILAAASGLISNNRHRRHKELWTRNADGPPVHLWEFGTGDAEAGKIGEKIATLHEGGQNYSDIAIFYRVNALSRVIEDELRRRRVPYRIIRGVEFYGRREIKDTLAYLRVLVNPADDVALSRIINVPARGIGDTTVQRLEAVAAEQRKPLLEIVRTQPQAAGSKAGAKRVQEFARLLDDLRRAVPVAPAADALLPNFSVAEVVKQLLQMSGLEALYRREQEEGGEDRLANVRELVTVATAFDEENENATVADFLTRMALVSDQDALDSEAGAVQLMTLHAAKGLEFPVVFIVGIEQGMLPHERALRSRDSSDLEEERRLCFVGMTRAVRELHLSHAAQRLINGALLPRSPSVFLGELPPAALERRTFEMGRSSAGAFDDPDPYSSGRRPSGAGWRPRLGLRRAGDIEPVFTRDDPAGQVALPAGSPYAGWTAGTLVQHDSYGVGQVVWIHPAPGQTRAGVKFPRIGEKTFILEFTPIRKLARDSAK